MLLDVSVASACCRTGRARTSARSPISRALARPDGRARRRSRPRRVDARARSASRWSAGSDADRRDARALRRCCRASVVPRRAPLATDASPTRFLALARRCRASAPARADAPASAAPTPRRRGALPRARRRAVASMPPLARGAMVPEQIERRFLRRLLTPAPRARATARAAALRRRAARAQRRPLPWTRVAHAPPPAARRPGADPEHHRQRLHGQRAAAPGRARRLEVAIVLFFGALFGWISIGFWTATLGFFTARRPARPLRDHQPRSPTSPTRPIAPDARTAIVMPICEEPVDRVFAGLQAIHRSLERAGALEHFDFFVLSDTQDPEHLRSRRRRRGPTGAATSTASTASSTAAARVRLKRKSGNVADFCRRWGRQYRYMIMLDADSIMCGRRRWCSLVRMMERSPDVGMIQTAPTRGQPALAVRARAAVREPRLRPDVRRRAALLAARRRPVLGPQRDHPHRAVHGALRACRGCPGKPPLGGEILSHDFVEAALMGRAGWTLWLAYDLPAATRRCRRRCSRR